MGTEKHEVLLRLRAIELIAYWEGRLVTNRLVNWFGISRQQASSDIKRYLSLHNPGALVHEPAVKAYVPAANFRPVLTRGHVNEYMELVSGLVSDSASLALEVDVNAISIQLPDRVVQPEVVRALMHACRNKSQARIGYASMSNPEFRARIISPHTLVYTGFRWHVRAYCHEKDEFRDFVLSRIEGPISVSDGEVADSGADELWHELITLTLVPNQGLSSGQQALVERDYGMENGRLQVKVRAALAHYTLQRFQAAITAEDIASTLVHPVQLLDADREYLSPFLFGHT